MASLRIDKDTFNREREVVKEERRMRVENQPYGRLSEIIYDQTFTVAPVQAHDDRQHEGPRGGVGRRRARVLPHLLRAEQRHAGARRRLRRRSRRSRSSNAVPRPGAEVRRGRSRATCPTEPRADAGAARHAARELAAAGRRRRAPRHLRRPPGLVPAAHRVEDPVRRPELADLPEARLRAGAARWRRSAAATSSRTRTCSSRSAIVQPGQTPDEVETALIAELDRLRTEPVTDHELAAGEEPVRARLHHRPRVEPGEGERSSRTPSSSTRATSRPPTASSTSS